MKLLPAIVTAVFLLPAALPQRAMPRDNRYDVVSIRSGSVPGVYNSFQGSQTTFNSTLKSLMANAFGVHEQDLIGLPKWAEAERFTIVAKAKSPVRDNLDRYTMLQSVFQERFALKYHPEKEDHPGLSGHSRARRNPPAGYRSRFVRCARSRRRSTPASKGSEGARTRRARFRGVRSTGNRRRAGRTQAPG